VNIYLVHYHFEEISGALFIFCFCLHNWIFSYVFYRTYCWTVWTKRYTSRTLSTSRHRRAPIKHRTLSCQSSTGDAKEFLDLQSAKERYAI